VSSNLDCIVATGLVHYTLVCVKVTG